MLSATVSKIYYFSKYGVITKTEMRIRTAIDLSHAEQDAINVWEVPFKYLKQLLFVCKILYFIKLSLKLQKHYFKVLCQLKRYVRTVNNDDNDPPIIKIVFKKKYERWKNNRN